MMKLLIIGLGGFLGAIARYGVSHFVGRQTGGAFPWGTLVVNVSGCLLIGVLMVLFQERQALGQSMRLFLMIGLLGAFTTFSTFGYETLELLREGSWAAAAWSVALNVFVGLAAVWGGMQVARLFTR